MKAGMARRTAEALCPSALSLDRDPAGETRRFEPVLGVIEDLIPRVEVVEPGWVFVPIDGAIRYYGGEEATRGSGSRDGEPFGGGGPFRGGRRSVRGVLGSPISPLDPDRRGRPGFSVRTGYLGPWRPTELIATFRWLGVTTLGGLAGLPRGAVASRFGARGLEAHRLASGEDRMVVPRHIPPDLVVERTFEEPLQLLEQVGFRRPEPGRNPHGLVGSVPGCAPSGGGGSGSSRGDHAVAGMAERRPRFDDQALAERVWWQLRAWTETGGVPGGLARLKLSPADLSDEGYQPGLFERTAARIEAERALERTRTLLGPDLGPPSTAPGWTGSGRAGAVDPMGGGVPRAGPLPRVSVAGEGFPSRPRAWCHPAPGTWTWSGTPASRPGYAWPAGGNRWWPGRDRGEGWAGGGSRRNRATSTRSSPRRGPCCAG